MSKYCCSKKYSKNFQFRKPTKRPLKKPSQNG